MAPHLFEGRRESGKFGPWLSNAVQQFAEDQQSRSPGSGSAVDGKSLRVKTSGASEIKKVPLSLSPAHQKSSRDPSPGGYPDFPAAVRRDVGTKLRTAASQRSPSAKGKVAYQASGAPAPDSVDAAVRLFIDAHPGFKSEVWCISQGRYMIRGRDVEQITNASALVLVDGWQRPLGETLEELYQEYTLERRAEAGSVAKKILVELIEQDCRRTNLALLRKCFQGLHKLGLQRRCLSFLTGTDSLSCRRVWAAWVRFVGHSRGDTYTLENMQRGLQVMKRLLFNSGFMDVCFSAWRSYAQCSVIENTNVMDSHALGAGFARLSNLRTMLPNAIQYGFEMKQASTTVHCFMRWAWEVQGLKRRSAEAFLVGQKGLLKRDLQLIESQSKAKDLLLSTWNGPEAQLSRLSGVVDGFLERLDVKARMPIVTTAVQRATAEEPYPWHKTMDAIGEMEHLRKSAWQLRCDIANVMAIRCFSAWVRAAGDSRMARGQEALNMRADVLAVQSHVVLTRMENVLHVTHRARTLRHSFATWVSAVPRLKLAGVALQDVMRHCQEFGPTRTVITEAFAMARHSAYHHVREIASHALMVVISRWFQIALHSRQARFENDLSEMRSTLAVADQARNQASASASNALYLRIHRRQLHTMMLRWHLCAHKGTVNRRRQQQVQYHMTRHDLHVMRQTFLALSSVLHTSAARRVIQKYLDFLKGSHALSQCSVCFDAWCGTLHLVRGQRSYRLGEDHFMKKKGRINSHMDAVMHHIMTEFLMSAVRSTFMKWQTEYVSARREAAMMQIETQYSRLHKDDRLSKEMSYRQRAKVSIIVENMAWSSIRMSIFVRWAAQTYKAAQDHRHAGNWLQRKRHQESHVATSQGYEMGSRTSSLTSKFASLMGLHMVVHCFKAWRRVTPNAVRIGQSALLVFAACGDRSTKVLAFANWRRAAFQRRRRFVVGRYGRMIINSGKATIAARVLLAWRSAALSRHCWVPARRLLALQALVPLLCRGPRLALRQWRENAHDSCVTAEKIVAAKVDALLGRKALAYWAWRARASSLINRELTGIKIQTFRSWQMAARESQHLRWIARSRRGNQLNDVTVDRAMREQERRSKSMYTFIKWQSASTLGYIVPPKYFSAWVLAVIQQRQDFRVDLLAQRMVNLDIRYKSAADQLLGQAVMRTTRWAIMLECWLSWMTMTLVACFDQELVVGSHKFHHVRSVLASYLGRHVSAQIFARHCFAAWKYYWKTYRRQTFSLRRNAERRLLMLLMGCWNAWFGLARAYTRGAARVRQSVLRRSIDWHTQHSLIHRCMTGWFRCAALCGRTSTFLSLVERVKKRESVHIRYACLMRWAHESWMEATAAVKMNCEIVGVRQQQNAKFMLQEMVKSRKENKLWRMSVVAKALMSLRLTRLARLLEAWHFAWRSSRRQTLTSCFINRMMPDAMSLKHVSFVIWARRFELIQESEVDMAEESDLALAAEGDESGSMTARFLNGSARGLPPRGQWEDRDIEALRGRGSIRGEARRAGNSYPTREFGY